MKMKETKIKSLLIKTALIAASALAFIGFNPISSSAEAVDRSAKEISFGDQESVDLKGSSAAKWYKITLDDSYMVELYGESSSYQHGPGIGVYDENGSLKFSLPLFINTKGVEKANLEKGTYYIKASLSGGNDMTDPINIKFHMEIAKFNLKKPKVKASAGNKVIVSWKKLSSVKGFEVQISTSKDFSKNVKKYTVNGAKKTSKTLTLPKKMRGKKVYVRIRPFTKVAGVKGFADYSPVASKKF